MRYFKRSRRNGFFDQLIMSVPVDLRWPISDDSIPFVNNAVNTMVSKNWRALRMYDQMFQQYYSQLNFKVAFRDDQPETAKIYRRFDDYPGASKDKKISHEMVEKFSPMANLKYSATSR